jgi:hypothetical protein
VHAQHPFSSEGNAATSLRNRSTLSNTVVLG